MLKTNQKMIIQALVLGMLITGVGNTILIKYQDKICVENCNTANQIMFYQPILQTLSMFIGESTCLLLFFAIKLFHYYIQKQKSGERMSLLSHSETDSPGDTGLNRMHRNGLVWLIIPSICDVCATTFMNVGLSMIDPSVFQMTRGSLVLFVGLFSRVFLSERLLKHQWFSLMLVMIGVFIVGVSGILSSSTGNFGDDTYNARITAYGIVTIILGQSFTAAQFVIEEFIMSRYSLDPIKVVGWEGLFGGVIVTAFMLFMHVAYGALPAGRGGLFDLYETYNQLFMSTEIWVATVLFMISIAFFNFFGLTVTRKLSCTARSTIDTFRTLFIWLVSLYLGWEIFRPLQILGFVFLVYGTFSFNGIIPIMFNLSNLFPCSWLMKANSEDQK